MASKKTRKEYKPPAAPEISPIVAGGPGVEKTDSTVASVVDQCAKYLLLQAFAGMAFGLLYRGHHLTGDHNHDEKTCSVRSRRIIFA
ncbi:hypothetical protein LK540_04700 [Massilia sp. IC2-278]|uniref:hypothetical protein n=1 Tax=Massilia sp. IC2-278 TaxID=2887200 RepID=UPI001E62A941|nr:hypothetical protein [Massilia sp. IC2-278]MCC2959729.1 hypothetical protein [Massilia sp. IC2-278]